MITMPTFPEYGDFRYLIDLDGTRYGFRMFWLSRTASWYFTLRDSDGNDIVTGVRCSLGAPLLRRHGVSTGLIPRGQLFLVDRSGENRDIERQEELGDRVQLLYATADEWESVIELTETESPAISITVP